MRAAFGTVIFNQAVSLVVARDSSFIPLPIVFNGLWGHFDGSGTAIQWQTSCELNSYGFFIERSVDGVNWQYIGLLLSKNKGCQLPARCYGNPHC